MTILSLDSAATETLAEIWATTSPSASSSFPHTQMLRGVSEFCDYPPALLRDVPKVTKSLVRQECSSEEMEAQIQALHAQGIRDLHTIDTALVAAARPGLLLTQDTCDTAVPQTRHWRLCSTTSRYLAPAPCCAARRRWRISSSKSSASAEPSAKGSVPSPSMRRSWHV